MIFDHYRFWRNSVGPRVRAPASPTVVDFDRFRFDTRRLALWRRDGTRLPLTNKAAEFLAVLLSKPGQVVSKSEFLRLLWPQKNVEESNLTQTVYVLRQTLADSDGSIIRTAPRQGYTLVSTVRPHARHEIRQRFVLALMVAGVAVGLLFVGSSGWRAKTAGAVLLPTSTLKAYDVGRLAWADPTTKNLERSRVLFLGVTREAPTSPLGFAGLSDTYYSLSIATPDRALSLRYRLIAKDQALHALALDRSSSEAHLAMARPVAAFGNATGAEKEFQNALALDPHNSLAHRWYGFFCLSRARYACASSELATANALDPRAWQNLYWLGVSYYYARDFQRATNALTEAIQARPAQPDTQLLLALAWEERGRSRECDLLLNKLASQKYHSAELAAIRAFNSARHGNTGAATREIAPILRMPASEAPGAITVAATLAELGRTQQARWWLKHRYAPDDASIFPMNDPRLDGVREKLFGEPGKRSLTS